MQSRHERILYSTTLHAKGNIIIVATRGTSGFSHAIENRHFFGLRLVQSLSLCRNGSKLPCDGIWQEHQAEQVLQFPSIGFGLSPQSVEGHIQTLRCTKTDKITNNCPSCRTHMAIVILQEKNLMKSTLP